MSASSPWSTAARQIAYDATHLRVHRDQVTFPDGQEGGYDWFETADQVRVAALVGSNVLLIEQHHYLVGRSLQLPGGNVDPPEADLDAARRELVQETGYHGGTWHNHGYLHPLPGLSPVRIHLWSVRGLVAGPANPESTERDLKVMPFSLRAAVSAAMDGRVTCSASVALILGLAATRP